MKLFFPSNVNEKQSSKNVAAQIILGIVIIIVVLVLCTGGIVLSYSALYESPPAQDLQMFPVPSSLRQNTQVCHTHVHQTDCSERIFCEWDWSKYTCVNKYTFSSQTPESLQECPEHHYPIKDKRACYEAAEFLNLNPSQVFRLRNYSHPVGCYFYNNELHLNVADTGNVELSGVQRLCQRKPEFCFNNIADCEHEETGVDCGGPCHETCAESSASVCATTTPAPSCTRFVAYSDKGWDARWGMAFLKKPYYFLHEMDCVSDEYIYSEKQGKCVIDQDGKLSIQVRHFSTTNPGCGVNGIGTPISFFNENEQCSYLYYVHPMGRTNEDEIIAGTKLTDQPWDTFRSQLQCSPTREDWDYWERCCFVTTSQY